jgi:hypothetical protein
MSELYPQHPILKEWPQPLEMIDGRKLGYFDIELSI